MMSCWFSHAMVVNISLAETPVLIAGSIYILYHYMIHVYVINKCHTAGNMFLKNYQHLV